MGELYYVSIVFDAITEDTADALVADIYAKLGTRTGISVHFGNPILPDVEDKDA